MSGSSTYRVVEVDEAGLDAAAVGGFIASTWQRRVALSVPRFFDWQFRDAPAQAGRNRCLVVVDAEARIHGFMGVTARDFEIEGRRLAGAELTTWVIAETLRGLGLGKAIVRRLQADYHVIIGMGISDSALPIYATHGFRYMRYMPRYVRVFDAERVAAIAKFDSFGERMLRRPLEPARAKLEVEPIGFREASGFAAALQGRFNHGVRDAAYLEWRYAGHPYYRYEAFRVAADRYASAVVVRVDDVNEELRVVHVVDLLAEAGGVPAVLAFLDAFCTERGAALADFYCTADPIGQRFWSRGWFSSVDDFYLQVPNWFHPIDMRVPPTTSLILWSRDDVGALLDRSRVYITKGDCDMDRPTLAYLEARGLAD